MNATMNHSETEALNSLDLDLFCLELGHQVLTRFTADIKRVLDERDAAFQAALAAHPATIAECERHQRESADYQRRKERRDFVASGAAARAVQEEQLHPGTPDDKLAAQLARQWHVPMLSNAPFGAHNA